MAEDSKPVVAKPNSGYLYPNDKKTTDKQPDYKGKLNDEKGKEWLVSAWKRMKDGKEMLSIALTDPATLAPRTGNTPASNASTPAARPAPTPSPAAAKPTGEPLKEISPEFGDLFDTL